MNARIVPSSSTMRDELLDLAIRSWEPVFEGMEQRVPTFVHDNFYPRGWESRQRADLARVLDEEPESVDVALVGQ